METCRACGARLSGDLDWCGQCLTPIQRVEVGAAAATGPHASAPPWMRSPDVRRTEPLAKPQFSRWRSGPTSFGAGGRILLTLLILVGAVIGYPLAKGMVVMSVGMDVPSGPFLVMYAFIAVPACLYLLAKVWKRARVA